MFSKARHLYSTAGYTFPYLLAFLLPFGINYAPILLLWTACYLLFGEALSGFKQAFKNPWTYILLGFFGLHLAGYWFSANKGEALTSIEVKMSFFAFPLLLFCHPYDDLKIKKIVIAFVSGCLISMLFCLFKASYTYLFEHTNTFFYSEFSYFLHPSYLAMYLVLAQLIVMLYYKQWLSHISNLGYKMGFMTIIFLTGIFLSSSKMGILSALLILPLSFAAILFHRGYKKAVIGLAVSLMLGIGIMYQLFPSPFERIKVAFAVTASSQQIDKTATESTAVRILIWNEAAQIIKENFLFGVSPGDANDRLYKAYEENGMTGALAKKLNAHNQYLQTFIGTGSIGFVLLCLITAGTIAIGFIKRNYMLALFSILMTLNFLVESMLQTQAGIVFFVFFLCFFLKYNLSALKPAPEQQIPPQTN